jgi:hypothetical protein
MRHRKFVTAGIVIVLIGLVGTLILGLALPTSSLGRLLRGSAGTRDTEGRGTVEITVFSGWSEQAQAHIRWDTAVESGISGFFLCRSDDGQEPYQRLTAEMIPSTAPVGSGATYDFVDADVSAGETYYYKLEPVDNLGSLATHGPISVAIYPTSALPPRRPGRIFLPSIITPP